MEFASLAAFLVVVLTLCLGERRIRVHLARRSGQPGPHRQRPSYALASMVKLLAKRPARAPREGGPVRRLASVLAFAAPLIALAALPVGRGLQLLPSNVGMLVVLISLAFAVFGRKLAGCPAVDGCPPEWNGLVVINLGLIMLGVLMLPGSADLSRVVDAQASVLAWFAWRQPFGLVLLLLLTLLVHDREPAETESPSPTLPASLRRSRSGVGFDLYRVGLPTRILFPALAVTLYLGGWSPGIRLPAGAVWAVASVVTFAVKTLLVLCGVLWLQRTLSRLRRDQAERLGWKLILPCAVANLALTAVGLTLYRFFVSAEDGALGP